MQKPGARIPGQGTRGEALGAGVPRGAGRSTSEARGAGGVVGENPFFFPPPPPGGGFRPPFPKPGGED